MQPIGTLAYTLAAGSVDLMIYNTIAGPQGVQWVCWKKGVGPDQFRKGLFEARVILEWDDTEYVYDFHKGGYKRLKDHQDTGWFRPDACFCHDGGTVAILSPGTQNGESNGWSEGPGPASTTLTDLALDSSSPLKIEMRSRPAENAVWHSRIATLCAKTASRTPVETGVGHAQVAVAA